MKSADLMRYLDVFIAFLGAYIMGMYLFGAVAHESGHALVCFVFGLPFSMSLTQVTYVPSPNPFVNLLARLAGGLSEAFFSLIALSCTLILEQRALTQSAPKIRPRTFRRSPKGSIFFGFETGLLAVTFEGIRGGIWEGLFFTSYKQLGKNLLINGAGFVASGTLAFVLLKIARMRVEKQEKRERKMRPSTSLPPPPPEI